MIWRFDNETNHEFTKKFRAKFARGQSRKFDFANNPPSVGKVVATNSRIIYCLTFGVWRL